jgi:hypothetical protein
VAQPTVTPDPFPAQVQAHSPSLLRKFSGTQKSLLSPRSSNRVQYVADASRRLAKPKHVALGAEMSRRNRYADFLRRT